VSKRVAKRINFAACANANFFLIVFIYFCLKSEPAAEILLKQ
jgi:hypothetical protein